MAEEPSQAIFSRLELAELVEEDGDSRKLLAEPGELMEPKRFCWSGPAAALSALFLVAVAGVAWYVALPSHSEVSPAMMQMKVAKHACMAQCPKPRRLKEKEEPDPAIALENCMEKCPSSGFMAAVEFEGCKAACESKHPQSGKMAKMPAGGPPMEACKQKCADGISGNFWRVRLQRCANKCAITTAAQEVMDQMKYNISSPELRDLETEVVSVLKKRITFKKRPDDHPFSFLIYQCKSKTEDALAKALGIPDGHAKPSVIMRSLFAMAQRLYNQEQQRNASSTRLLSTASFLADFAFEAGLPTPQFFLTRDPVTEKFETLAEDYEQNLASPPTPRRRTWWLPWNMILDAGEWLLDVFSRVWRPLRDNMCSLRTKKLQ